MKTLLILVCFAAAFPGIRASAQTKEEKELLAKGPAIAALMPAFSQWTVDITYKDGSKATGEIQLENFKKAAEKDPLLAKQMANMQFQFSLRNIRPKHIAVVKTGNIRHTEQALEGGYSAESWSFDLIEVERKANTRKLMVRSVPEEATTDFPELQWVAPNTFTGVRSDAGRKILVFKQDRYDDEHLFLGSAYAFINAETRQPIAYQYLGETRQYTILPPPTAALSVPEDFKTTGKAAIARIQNATPHLSPP